MSKPFNPEVLLARAGFVLRRSERSDEHLAVLDYDDGYLKIDVERHCIFVKDRQVKLTPLEFRLLIYLASNAGKVLSFDWITYGVANTEGMTIMCMYTFHTCAR